MTAANEFEPRIQGGSPKQFCSGYCRLRWHRTRYDAKMVGVGNPGMPRPAASASPPATPPRSIAPSPAGSGEYKTRPEYKERRHREGNTYYRRHSEAINARERRKRARRNRCECGVLKPRTERQCQRCAALPIANEVLKR